MQLFRKLDAAQEAEFRQWARANYQPLSEISGVWHPVVQDECARINAEAGENVDLGRPPEPKGDMTIVEHLRRVQHMHDLDERAGLSSAIIQMLKALPPGEHYQKINSLIGGSMRRERLQGRIDAAMRYAQANKL